jgi:uncharacterized membrane protein
MIDPLTPAFVVAFVITLLELAEVVILVFAITAGDSTIRHAAVGAMAGVAVVAAIALGSGAALLSLGRSYLLWASAVVLAGFGVFLFRSTLKSYRRARAAALHPEAPPPPPHWAVRFAGGFSVGAIESTEAVIVLLALTAAGFGASAITGALVAGAVLVALTFAVGSQLRRIKVPWLKLGATSMVFSFALFWGGEAANRSWPGGDLFLAVLFVAGLVLVRGGVAVALRLRPVGGPSPPSGSSGTPGAGPVRPR